MKKSATSRQSRTDWARVDALKDEQIDFSDTPEIAPEVFVQAVVRRALKPVPRKALITLRVDRDVLEWFKKRGPGYQTKVNALLRAYMEAHQVVKAREAANE